MGHFVCKFNIGNALISPCWAVYVQPLASYQTTSYQMYHKFNKMPIHFYEIYKLFFFVQYIHSKTHILHHKCSVLCLFLNNYLHFVPDFICKLNASASWISNKNKWTTTVWSHSLSDHLPSLFVISYLFAFTTLPPFSCPRFHFHAMANCVLF